MIENKRILRIVTRRDRTFVGDGEGGGASESAGTGSYEDELMFPLSQPRSHGYGHWQLFCGRCRQPYPHNHMHVTCRVATRPRSASTATPRAVPQRHFRAAARPEPGYAAHNDLKSVSISRPCCSYSTPGNSPGRSIRSPVNRLSRGTASVKSRTSRSCPWVRHSQSGDTRRRNSRHSWHMRGSSAPAGWS